jgi:hypothetical protein
MISFITLTYKCYVCLTYFYNFLIVFYFHKKPDLVQSKLVAIQCRGEEHCYQLSGKISTNLWDLKPEPHKTFPKHFSKHYNMITNLPGSLYWGWLFHDLMNGLDKCVDRHYTNCSYQMHQHLLIRSGCTNHLQLYTKLVTTSRSSVKCCFCCYYSPFW